MAPSFKATTTVDEKTYSATSAGYEIDVDATKVSAGTYSTTDTPKAENKIEYPFIFFPKKKGPRHTKAKRRK